MDDHWDTWLRHVVLFGGLIAIAALWWFDVIPDGVVGWPLLFAVTLGSAGAVLLRLREVEAGRTWRIAAIVCAVAGLGVAVWVPVHLLTPVSVVAERDVSAEDASLIIPPTGQQRDRYVVYLHAGLTQSEGDADVDLELHVPTQRTAAHHGHLADHRGAGKRGRGSVHVHDLSWALETDLHEGGELTVKARTPLAVRWPVHVEVHRAPPSPETLLLFGIPIFLVGGLIEARAGTNAGVAALAAGGIAFGVLFSQAYLPGLLTRAAFASAFGGAMIGLASAWLYGKIAGRIVAPREDAARA